MPVSEIRAMSHYRYRLLTPFFCALALASPAFAFVCGNGIVEPGEQCDDGNVSSDDGCSAMCIFEGCPLSGTWSDGFVGYRWSIVEDAGGVLTGAVFPSNGSNVSALSGNRVGASVTVTVAGDT